MPRAATTIKVLPETHLRLQKIANADQMTMGEIITILVDKYERERFWQGVAEDLEKFESDAPARSQYRDDFAEWDNQTTKLLAGEPAYYPGGEN